MKLARVLRSITAGWRPKPATPAPRLASLLASPHLPAAGWWRDDATEQLRHYQSWVFAAVNAIAQEAARQVPMVFRSTGQADHEQIPLPQTHPLCRLLDQPNPWLTAWELWYLTVVYLELTGNCYWYVAPHKTDGRPAELWIVPTPWVRIIPDDRDFIAGYEIRTPAGLAEQFRVTEIIHLKYPNPLDPLYGLSPLQANALTIDANLELLRSRYQTFLAGPRPGVVLQTSQSLSDLTVKRLEERLQDKFAGRENWHRPLVLEQGLSATPWTLTPAEMDFLNSGRMTRDEIFALFRVPPPVAGVMENTGLGADIWHGARTIFCEGTVQPKLDLMGQVLTRTLARRFGPDLFVRFADCSPRLAEQRRHEDETDARLGLRTVNEIRQARGLKPFPEAQFDRPLMSAKGGCHDHHAH